MKCSVNPAVGREAESVITPARVKKNIMIVGAGPGGMEAALIAGQRGHNVKLYEKNGELGGGQLRLAMNIKGKEDLNFLVEYHKNMFKKYDNIQVFLNTSVDKALVQKENPDVVIIATGGQALMLNCPGTDCSNVTTAFDLLGGKTSVGDNVIVAGGGLIGTETAQWLASQGKKVTIVEMLGEIATTLDFMTRFWLMEQLAKQAVTILTNTKVKEITENGVWVIGPDGKEEELKADSVVIAIGTTSYNELEKELEDIEAEVYTIGDAKQARKIKSAISEAYHLARKL